MVKVVKKAVRGGKKADKRNTSVKAKPPETGKKAKATVRKPVVHIKLKKKLKCCPHCPDYVKCEDRGECCEYCDHYLNGRCMYGKKGGLPAEDSNIELPDYRGDDFGIDDYEAYESVYE